MSDGGLNAAKSLCDRKASREAREIITDHIYPFLLPRSDPRAALSTDCPFNASLDMYFDQERHKSRVTGNPSIFQCGYCGKQFRMEFYMDRHMDNKHADKLIVPAGSSGCLADLCNVLGCGPHGHDACARANGRERGEGCAPCDKDKMALRRKRCKTLFNRCFDPSKEHGGDKMEHVRDLFFGQFCNHLACDENGHPLPAPPWTPVPLSSATTRGRLNHRYFLLGLLFVGLSIFYASLWVWSRLTRTRDDLRWRSPWWEKLRCYWLMTWAYPAAVVGRTSSGRDIHGRRGVDARGEAVTSRTMENSGVMRRRVR